MNIGKILKSVGMGLVREIPGADAIIGIVNGFLPADKKLPAEATGTQVQSAIDGLPEKDRASVMSKEIDLKIAEEEGWTDRYTAMVKADGQSSRARIAVMMAQILCFEIAAFTVWAFVYPEQMNNPVLWTVFGVLTGTPAGVLMKYFGELRKEQGQRLGASSGGSAGILSSLSKLLPKQ